jgi:hypothetical protein
MQRALVPLCVLITVPFLFAASAGCGKDSDDDDEESGRMTCTIGSGDNTYSGYVVESESACMTEGSFCAAYGNAWCTGPLPGE